MVSFVTDPYPEEISWSLTADSAPVLGVGLDGSTATYNTGGCVGGCTDPTACNYDDGSAADYDDGSCEGIAEGECDCEGNVLDALDECGGSCIEDSDSDGICDDVDLCIDTTACNYDANPTEACAMNDACGVCGGSGVDVDSDGICDDAASFCSLFGNERSNKVDAPSLDSRLRGFWPHIPFRPHEFARVPCHSCLLYTSPSPRD